MALKNPSERPEPDENMAVSIYGDDWEGAVDGYFLDGQWWRAIEGPDVAVTITGWGYRDD